MTLGFKAGLCLAAFAFFYPSQANAQSSDPVVVHVIDLYGKPVQNVSFHPEHFTALADGHTPTDHALSEIRTLSASFPAWTLKTDANGNAAFKDLPQGYTLSMGVQDNRYAQISADKHAHLELAADSPAITLIVSPGGTIEGAVKYAGSGRPAAGIRVGAVDLQPQTGQGISSATTDSRGHYKITQVIPDTYNLELDLQSPISDNWTATAHVKLPVPAAETISGMNFDLIPLKIVRGRVLDANGKKVAGATVLILDTRQEIKSNDDGTFRVILGTTKSACTLCAQQGTLATAQPVTAKSGASVDLRVVPKVLGKITGSVKDDHDAPIVYAYVSLHRGADIIDVAKTDIFGAYSFDTLLPNLSYSVTVDERGYITTNEAVGELKPGQSLEMTTLVIKKAQTSVASAVR